MALPDATSLPPSVQVQLETLHKALREKKKACKSLEEKLATALTSPETARRALEQEDKGVQVDLQDLVTKPVARVRTIGKRAVAQFSLKSLQVYDDYGVSKDPLQLQAQVRQLKVQLENQTKLILQMQRLLRRNSLSSDLVSSPPDPSTIRDQAMMHGEDKSREMSYRSGAATGEQGG
ncbi:hypothetical protein KUCAC02_009368 [Chaenocephalus aceratus]|uniref:Uncharacterized protein n=1 Tax=Chaenocephalus aceratus TaxID=36190 RepID=A0ACB9WUT4_CHAAC|nr:hypothetical protein KUCAC02_009368 [Chaenocephalus aceratus]